MKQNELWEIAVDVFSIQNAHKRNSIAFDSHAQSKVSEADTIVATAPGELFDVSQINYRSRTFCRLYDLFDFGKDLFVLDATQIPYESSQETELSIRGLQQLKDLVTANRIALFAFGDSL